MMKCGGSYVEHGVQPKTPDVDHSRFNQLAQDWLSEKIASKASDEFDASPSSQEKIQEMKDIVGRRIQQHIDGKMGKNLVDQNLVNKEIIRSLPGY